LMTIDPRGVVQVNVTASVEPGINLFECPVKPILATMSVFINGDLAPAIHHNNSVIVVSDRSGYVTISYIANATIEDGEIRFWYGSTREATLVVPPNVVLMSLPESLVKAYVDDERKLHLVFKGPCTISFVVGEWDQAPATPIALLPGDLLWYAVVALAVVVLVALARKATKRVRGGLVSAAYLDEVDREILERIRRHGGEVVQSVLYKELNTPKATLWRHVKKLERLGYVAVERVGRDNRVKLLR